MVQEKMKQLLDSVKKEPLFKYFGDHEKNILTAMVTGLHVLLRNNLP